MLSSQVIAEPRSQIKSGLSRYREAISQLVRQSEGSQQLESWIASFIAAGVLTSEPLLT